MDLTEKVLAFQAGSWTWRALWESIMVEIATFVRTHRIPDDQAILLCSELGPRLLNMVDGFTYYGKSFNAFLYKSLKYQLKTLHRDRRRQTDAEQALVRILADDDLEEQAAAENLSAGEALMDDGEIPEVQRLAVRKMDAQKRRLLIVALKNCEALSDSTVHALSRATGLSETWLMNCRDELRELSRNRNDRVRDLRMRERSLRVHVQCGRVDANGEIMARQRLEALGKRISTMQPFPQHRHIARTLGIPKGSVDSSLYYLRHEFATVLAHEDPDR